MGNNLVPKRDTKVSERNEKKAKQGKRGRTTTRRSARPLLPLLSLPLLSLCLLLPLPAHILNRLLLFLLLLFQTSQRVLDRSAHRVRRTDSSDSSLSNTPFPNYSRNRTRSRSIVLGTLLVVLLSLVLLLLIVPSLVWLRDRAARRARRIRKLGVGVGGGGGAILG